MNLLSNIDHSRFDVSAFYEYSSRSECRKNEAAIDPRVRLFSRSGGIVPSKRHRRDRIRLQTRGVTAPGLDVEAMKTVFRGEWRRCFGESDFDYVIDYSGYAPYWAFLMLQGKAKSHSIWLHSDVRADQMREVNGQRPHEVNLRSVFTTYPLFDHLVSVSPTLRRINAEKLADAVSPDKHAAARNSINHERVLRLAYGPQHQTDVEVPHFPGAVETRDLSSAIALLSAEFGVGNVAAEVERRKAILELLPEAQGVFTFVSVGRLSPEKNYARLIRAFDLVHQENSETRLVIMGGGPTMSDLQGLVRGLGLSDMVTLAGHQTNPFAVMAHADCFVLSSDYEGQPMVFLEAGLLGLPIVTTDFPSIEGALPGGTGLVVARSVDALADGMQSAIEGRVPRTLLDGPAYNAEVMAEFYRAIGADT